MAHKKVTCLKLTKQLVSCLTEMMVVHHALKRVHHIFLYIRDLRNNKHFLWKIFHKYINKLNVLSMSMTHV
jgi:hypothetical protein